MDPMTCECLSWASDQPMLSMLGNGHHQECQHYVPNVGAIELINQLVDGIKWWADQEDGVPDELWEAYKKAVFITRGTMLSDDAM